MTNKRKQVQDYVITWFKKLDTTGREANRMAKFFASLSDAQFDEYMKDLRDKKDVLFFYHANVLDENSIDRMKAIAKELKIKLFERIRMWDVATQSYYITPFEFMVIKIPVRRMSQFQDHKLSVPEGDSKIDMLSGQVVKPDKAGSISQVETQALFANGLDNTILELIKFRGGDVTAFAEYKRELEETGRVSIGRETHSVPRSAVTLDVFMSGMHIESNASGL